MSLVAGQRMQINFVHYQNINSSAAPSEIRIRNYILFECKSVPIGRGAGVKGGGGEGR